MGPCFMHLFRQAHFKIKFEIVLWPLGSYSFSDYLVQHMVDKGGGSILWVTQNTVTMMTSWHMQQQQVKLWRIAMKTSFLFNFLNPLRYLMMQVQPQTPSIIKHLLTSLLFHQIRPGHMLVKNAVPRDPRPKRNKTVWLKKVREKSSFCRNIMW